MDSVSLSSHRTCMETQQAHPDKQKEAKLPSEECLRVNHVSREQGMACDLSQPCHCQESSVLQRGLPQTLSGTVSVTHLLSTSASVSESGPDRPCHLSRTPSPGELQCSAKMTSMNGVLSPVHSEEKPSCVLPFHLVLLQFASALCGVEASPWSQVLAAIKGKMAPARKGTVCLTGQHLRGRDVILMQVQQA